MNDRELLEMAAKAAGDSIQFSESWNDFLIEPIETETIWNPLTYDDDALRLAVRLGLSVYTPEDANDYASAHGKLSWHNEDQGSDPYAATRRAIVRAAAEIGRGMK